jgi:hypothetical protein
VILHPALGVQLQADALVPSKASAPELEALLLAVWNGYGADGADTYPYRAALLAALELTLAQDEVSFVRYLESVRASLAPVEKSDLWHLLRARVQNPSIRMEAYRAIYSDEDKEGNNSSRQPSCLTRTQATVAEKMIRLGRIFFDQDRQRFPIEPRLCPLLIGKTGAGKGHVISHVAKVLQCHVVHITFGDWIVSGAHSDYVPTLWSLIEAIINHDRVLVVLDEIDKFDANVSSPELTTWARSACNELWALLDRRLPITEFIKSPKAAGTGTLHSETELRKRVKEHLWIVGIGTWQHLHQPERSLLGFHATTGVAPVGIAHRLAQGAGISHELLFRFNPTPLELNYPSVDELESLLEMTGVAEAARTRGISIDVHRLDLAKGGMRVIEDLVTQILLADTDIPPL